MRSARESNRCLLLVVGWLAIAIPTGLVWAEVVTNTTIPVDKAILCNPCVPTEEVTVSGDVHMVSSVTISDSGNVTTKTSVNFESVKLTTLNGDVYQANNTDEQTFSDKAVFPLIQSLETDTEFVKPGPNNNFKLHVTFHLTINSNGVVTATVDNLRVDCNK